MDQVQAQERVQAQSQRQPQESAEDREDRNIRLMAILQDMNVLLGQMNGIFNRLQTILVCGIVFVGLLSIAMFLGEQNTRQQIRDVGTKLGGINEELTHVPARVAAVIDGNRRVEQQQQRQRAEVQQVPSINQTVNVGPRSSRDDTILRMWESKHDLPRLRVD